MRRGPFEPNFDDLPLQIPLFPLPGALLLPGGKLPLNIFEPRYLAMVKDAMASPHRLIGMIQPVTDDSGKTLYDVGCAGRISEFSESDISCAVFLTTTSFLFWAGKLTISISNRYKCTMPKNRFWVVVVGG